MLHREPTGSHERSTGTGKPREGSGNEGAKTGAHAEAAGVRRSCRIECVPDGRWTRAWKHGQRLHVVVRRCRVGARSQRGPALLQV